MGSDCTVPDHCLSFYFEYTVFFYVVHILYSLVIWQPSWMPF